MSRILALKRVPEYSIAAAIPVSTPSNPYRATSSTMRASAIAVAAIWLIRSPQSSSGNRGATSGAHAADIRPVTDIDREPDVRAVAEHGPADDDVRLVGGQIRMVGDVYVAWFGGRII